MTIRKLHSLGSLQSYNKHNSRELYLKNVDESRSVNNEELVNESGDSYRDLWYRRIKEAEIEYRHPVKVRKNAVIAIDIVTTFSKDADIDLEEWKKENVRWMRETFGEENVISMQLHDDEVTPHIHTVVVPINSEGRLCARDFTGGRKKMFDLQTSYAKAMEPLGLERGEMYSRTRKEDLNHFYAVLNKASDEKVPERLPEEPVEEFEQRMNEYVRDMSMRMVGRERELKREAEKIAAKFAQFRVKYKDAVILQDTVESQCEDNPEEVKKRLQTYQTIEKAVPRATLDGFLLKLLSRFVGDTKKDLKKDTESTRHDL